MIVTGMNLSQGKMSDVLRDRNAGHGFMYQRSSDTRGMVTRHNRLDRKTILGPPGR